MKTVSKSLIASTSLEETRELVSSTQAFISVYVRGLGPLYPLVLAELNAIKADHM